MGLQLRSLTMLVLLIYFLQWQIIEAQTPARSLDAILQDYAYQAFVRPRTGIPFDGSPPSNLSGIQISAIRLRSGSLFTRGVPTYKEFRIPIGVIEQPYVERLVLVYQNLGNWSTVYYPLPGYIYLSPILGLLAYDASDLSAKNLPELPFRASEDPISIEFQRVNEIPDDSSSIAKCVHFDLNGQTNFTDLVSGRICETFEQGHFAIVVNSTTAPSPAPAPPPPPPQPPRGGGGNNNGKRVGIIIGAVAGGILLLVLLALLVLWIWRLNKKKKMNKMEKAADSGEALQMTVVGNTKAPAATTTRTQPNLETEYVP